MEKIILKKAFEAGAAFKEKFFYEKPMFADGSGIKEPDFEAWYEHALLTDPEIKRISQIIKKPIQLDNENGFLRNFRLKENETPNQKTYVENILFLAANDSHPCEEILKNYILIKKEIK